MGQETKLGLSTPFLSSVTLFLVSSGNIRNLLHQGGAINWEETRKFSRSPCLLPSSPCSFRRAGVLLTSRDMPNHQGNLRREGSKEITMMQC